MLEREPAGVIVALRALPGVREVEMERAPDGFPIFRVQSRRQDDADLCPAIYELARQEAWPLRELHRDVRTLESVFNELAMAGQGGGER